MYQKFFNYLRGKIKSLLQGQSKGICDSLSENIRNFRMEVSIL